jgi:hypothetical protein
MIKSTKEEKEREKETANVSANDPEKMENK